MASDSCYEFVLRCFFHGSSGATFWHHHPQRKRMVLPVLALAATLAMTLVVTVGGGEVVLHAGEFEQIIVPNLLSYHQAGDIWSILDLTTSVSLPEYAFAQASDSTPPTFVASELDTDTGVLTITFSETIDVANVFHDKMHIRKSGNYTGGITLSTGEFVTVANSTAISFNLTESHLTTVTGLTTSELTIEPGAVQDTSGNLIVGTFDASTAVFVDATSIQSKDDDPRGMTFSNDGTKMFVVGNQNNAIIEYTLSPAFDISTAVFADTFSVSSEEDVPTGMAFSNNGTKMFVVGYLGNTTEYALSTAFNISTAVFADTSVSSEYTWSSDITFSNDGTKMFVVNLLHDIITGYILSPAFDVSTAVFVPPSFSVASEETFPLGMTFSNDGTKMFVVGSDEEAVNEYTLSPAFDVSAAVFVDATLISATEDIYLSGVAFSNDGAKMFVVETYDADIYEYTLSSVYPITVTGITVSDTPPVIELDGPVTITIAVGGTYSDQGAVCTDDVDANRAATVGGDIVNTASVGTYVITYDCTDTSNNPAIQVTRTVTVEDVTAPVITLVGSNPATITVGTSYSDAGVTCDDNVDGAITPTSSSTVDVNNIGNYTVTYSCTDAAGNDAADVSRIVMVDAAPGTTVPVITLTGLPDITISLGDTYSDQGAVCTDDVDADRAATVGGDIVNTASVGTYVITYDCTDTSNNPAIQVTRTVMVQPGPVIDTTPPVITLIGSDTATVTVDTSYNDAGATCRDDVDGSITPTFFSTVDVSQTGNYSVTYSCTDVAGNNATPVSRAVLVHEVGEYQRSSSRSVPLTTDSSMTINGQSYQLGSETVTIEPYTVTTGHGTDIEFIAYSTEDIIHFTVYLDLHDDDVGYSDRGTYVRYDQGTVKTNDPNGFISYASITITEDEEDSDKKIISVVIEFDGAMGLTNMVVYMWDEDRGSSFIRIFDALDVTAESEPVEPEPRQEPLAPDFEDDAADPEPVSSDTLWPADDYDDTQVLTLIRMWSGFESESITDAELLESLNLDYPDADIPNWMMTQLGVLVAKGDVTVEEFRTALVYMLEMLTA